eukprot:COSAG02_NODE_12886_length_1476_cov_2.088598_2_plen_194_part_00
MSLGCAFSLPASGPSLAVCGGFRWLKRKPPQTTPRCPRWRQGQLGGGASVRRRSLAMLSRHALGSSKSSSSSASHSPQSPRPDAQASSWFPKALSAETCARCQQHALVLQMPALARLPRTRDRSARSRFIVHTDTIWRVGTLLESLREIDRVRREATNILITILYTVVLVSKIVLPYREQNLLYRASPASRGS